MKTIAITIDKVGRPKVEAHGFAGCGCTAATDPIIKALSGNNEATLNVEAKAEMHMVDTEENHETISM